MTRRSPDLTEIINPQKRTSDLNNFVTLLETQKEWTKETTRLNREFQKECIKSQQEREEKERIKQLEREEKERIEQLERKEKERIERFNLLEKMMMQSMSTMMASIMGQSNYQQSLHPKHQQQQCLQ